MFPKSEDLFVADAIRPVAPRLPIIVVPHPVLARGPLATRSQDIGRDSFTVLLIFNCASGFERKNPLASIAAFRKAFGDDPNATLIVKASNLDVYPEGKALIEKTAADANNVRLLDMVMSTDEMAGLYTSSDALLSLHRSEGFGLTSPRR
jgi:hypothetical protein